MALSLGDKINVSQKRGLSSVNAHQQQQSQQQNTDQPPAEDTDRDRD
jgi:hypothetical protein